ncbi:MAG: hypothetical protein ABF582_02525 [Acetobacter okinawensis]
MPDGDNRAGLFFLGGFRRFVPATLATVNDLKLAFRTGYSGADTVQSIT